VGPVTYVRWAANSKRPGLRSGDVGLTVMALATEYHVGRRVGAATEGAGVVREHGVWLVVRLFRPASGPLWNAAAMPPEKLDGT